MSFCIKADLRFRTKYSNFIIFIGICLNIICTNRTRNTNNLFAVLNVRYIIWKFLYIFLLALQTEKSVLLYHTPVLNLSFCWLEFICYLYFEICDFLFGSVSSTLGWSWSELRVFWGTRKRDYIADITHPGNKQDQPFETQSKPAVRGASELYQNSTSKIHFWPS